MKDELLDEMSILHMRIELLREALEYIAANEDYYGVLTGAKTALKHDDGLSQSNKVTRS